MLNLLLYGFVVNTLYECILQKKVLFRKLQFNTVTERGIRDIFHTYIEARKYYQKYVYFDLIYTFVIIDILYLIIQNVAVDKSTIVSKVQFFKVGLL